MKTILKSSMMLAAAVFAGVVCAEDPVVAGDALLLKAGFEDTGDAEFATGDGVPEVRGAATVYKEGIAGKALLSGKGNACAIFYMQDNLDFNKPGTVTLWFKAENDWHNNPQPTVVLWGLGNEKGYMGLRLTGSAPCPCRRPLVLGIYSVPGRRNAEYRCQSPALSKACRNWHLVSMAWAGDTLYLSYDGAAYRSYKLQKPLSNEEFAHANRFAVGGQASSFLIDDFRIYGKKLSDEEIRSIWDAGNAK